jgi:hypothetical protein
MVHHFLGLLFGPEDRSDMVLGNVDEILPDYTVTHPIR